MSFVLEVVDHAKCGVRTCGGWWLIHFWCRPVSSRSDHLLQLQHDIATYFGYNNYLVGKLMVLFSAAEVSHNFAVVCCSQIVCCSAVRLIHLIALCSPSAGSGFLRGQRNAPSRDHPNKHPPYASTRPSPGAHQPWSEPRTDREMEQSRFASLRVERTDRSYARILGWTLHVTSRFVLLARHRSRSST